MKCVRCNSEYKISINPYSHFSTICDKCKKEKEETIFDQQKYNINPLKYINIKEFNK